MGKRFPGRPRSEAKEDASVRIRESQGSAVEPLQSFGEASMGGWWEREVEGNRYNVLLEANRPGCVEQREKRTRQRALIVARSVGASAGPSTSRSQRRALSAAYLRGCSNRRFRVLSVARLALGSMVTRGTLAGVARSRERT